MGRLALKQQLAGVASGGQESENQRAREKPQNYGSSKDLKEGELRVCLLQMSFKEDYLVARQGLKQEAKTLGGGEELGVPTGCGTHGK